MTTTPPLSLLADLARAAQAVETKRVTTGIDVTEHAPAMCAYREAVADPTVVLELVERVRSLEAEQEAYYQRAQEIGETYAAEIAETKRQAARIAELEAMQDKQALYITHLVMQIRGHDWHEEIMATRARIAELEAGLREACDIADEWITEAGASPGWGAGDRGEHARVARLRALLTP